MTLLTYVYRGSYCRAYALALIEIYHIGTMNIFQKYGKSNNGSSLSTLSYTT